MPRFRTIYNNVGLFAGPAPATGEHFLDNQGNLVNWWQSGDSATANLVMSLNRVQSLGFSINTNRNEIKHLGQRSVLSKSQAEIPTIDLSFEYIQMGVINEARLGFYTNYAQFNSGQSGAPFYPDNFKVCVLSGFITRDLVRENNDVRWPFSYRDKRNLFAAVAPEGVDLMTSSYQGKDTRNLSVLAFGNCYITSWRTDASINSFPKCSVSYIAENLEIHTSGTGLDIPALNPKQGNKISGIKCNIPTLFQGNNVTSAIIPGNITVDVTNVAQFLNVSAIDGSKLDDNSAAYSLPTGISGYQSWTGQLLTDFSVNTGYEVLVKKFGIVDISGQGLTGNFIASIYNRSNMSVPMVSITGKGLEGELISGVRYFTVPNGGFRLPSATQATFVISGFSSSDTYGDFNSEKKIWITNPGNSTLLQNKSGTAVNFDYLRGGHVTIPAFNAAIGNNFTFEAWINPKGEFNNNHFIFGQSNGIGAFEIATIAGSRKLGAVINGSVPASTTNEVIVENTWQHIAYTKTGVSGHQFFINGEAVATTVSLTTTFSDTNDIKQIGWEPLYTGFNGFIDEVRLWNYAKTQNEISGLKDIAITGLESGLVACWGFDERFGTVALDRSPNQRHGTYLSGYSWVDSPLDTKPYAHAPIYGEGALQFHNRSGTAVSLNSSASGHVVISSFNAGIGNNFTIETWIYPKTANNRMWIYGQGQTEFSFLFSLDADRKLATYWVNGYTAVTQAGIIPLNTWTHIAYVRTGTGALGQRFYVNGAPVATTIVNNTLFQDYNVEKYIGALKWLSANECFNGDIDEVRIWNYGRVQSEISGLMNSTVTGTELGLVGCWGLDEKIGTTAYDRSPYRRKGIYSGGYSWVNSPLKMIPDPYAAGTFVFDSYHTGSNQVSNVGFNIQDAKIQGYGIVVDMPREPLPAIGHLLPLDREIVFPVYARLNIDVVVGDYATGSVWKMFSEDEDYNISVKLRNPINKVETGIAVQYDFRRSKFEGVTYSESIGKNVLASLNFSVPIDPENYEQGFFMSGLLNINVRSSFEAFLLKEDGDKVLQEDDSRFTTHSTTVLY